MSLLTILLLVSAARDAERITQAQERYAMEAQSQHREITCVQPAAVLSAQEQGNQERAAMRRFYEALNKGAIQ